MPEPNCDGWATADWPAHQQNALIVSLLRAWACNTVMRRLTVMTSCRRLPGKYYRSQSESGGETQLPLLVCRTPQCLADSVPVPEDAQHWNTEPESGQIGVMGPRCIPRTWHRTSKLSDEALLSQDILMFDSGLPPDPRAVTSDDGTQFIRCNRAGVCGLCLHSPAVPGWAGPGGRRDAGVMTCRAGNQAVLATDM